MIFKRTIEINTEFINVPFSFKVGNIGSFDLTDGEPVEFMAVKDEGEEMLCVLVDCLRTNYRMNSRDTNFGGYERSEMRNTLNTTILNRFPAHIREMMVPFSNGDFIRLPTVREIFGSHDYGADEDESVQQWAPMKFRRNRIAFQGKNGGWTWYWLMNKVSSASFASVHGDGLCSNAAASYARGVRPAFKIKKSRITPPRGV